MCLLPNAEDCSSRTIMDDMAQYWSEYPLSEVDGQVPSALPAGRYVSVISNGHGALTAWVAGPGRCYRTPYPASAHPQVRVTRGDPSKEPEEVWFEPFTEEDLRTVNDDVNSYLAEAGVRLQPRGYTWHVLVPESIRDGEELELALREKNQYIEPAEVLTAIKRLYESLVSQLPPTS
ncbi:MAG: hypothetical protein K0Q46_4542 [Rhodococcus erythropolis]|nr:hypothetical protein [Rhodococcus erythropolis]